MTAKSKTVKTMAVKNKTNISKSKEILKKQKLTAAEKPSKETSVKAPINKKVLKEVSQALQNSKVIPETAKIKILAALKTKATLEANKVEKKPVTKSVTDKLKTVIATSYSEKKVEAVVESEKTVSSNKLKFSDILSNNLNYANNVSSTPLFKTRKA